MAGPSDFLGWRFEVMDIASRGVRHYRRVAHHLIGQLQLLCLWANREMKKSPYCRRENVRGIRSIPFLLLCASALCQTPGKPTPSQPLPDALPALAGTFESAARGDTFFGGGTTNAAPLFTVTLKTNSTYFVFCAKVSIEPHMDGGRNFLRAGREFGTWKWDREHSEVVFMATNRNHMMEVFPARMKVDTRDLNRLKVIQTAPTTGLPVGLASIPLSPPYFYRKIQ